MADVKWIKVTTDIFDDDKILLIESLPDADAIIVIWFKLLCLAGKQNNSGVFMMNDSIPYTDKMLSTIFRRKESTVQLALKTFEEFGMIKIIDGAITIPNWGKHQDLDQLEARREYMKNYMADYRGKQKNIACKVNSKVNVNKAEEIREEEIKKEKKLIVSKDTICSTDVQRVVDEWNSLGLSQITKITSGTDREKWLRKRIKDYGLDGVLRAIDNARRSDFLMNANFFSFDWMMRPNNFPKVLDGNYENKTKIDKGRNDWIDEL